MFGSLDSRSGAKSVLFSTKVQSRFESLVLSYLELILDDYFEGERVLPPQASLLTRPIA